MNTRSVVGGAALVFGDTLSVSYGVAYDKYRYNDRNRGGVTTLTQACANTRHCDDRGLDTYEYVTQKYAGWSAALNMGPVALKATRNHVNGHNAGAAGSIYKHGDTHSELNLSLAF